MIVLRRLLLGASLLGMATAAPSPAVAQEGPALSRGRLPLTPGSLNDPYTVWPEEKRGWGDTGEFQFLWTGGNSEVSTFGLRNLPRYGADRYSVSVRASGIRSKAGETKVTVVQDGTTRSTERETTSELRAESYSLGAEMDGKITDHFLWIAGAGWERNLFVGFNSRYGAKLGLANVWLTPKIRFRVEYAATARRSRPPSSMSRGIP